MAQAAPITASNTVTYQAPAAAVSANAAAGLSFSEVLSDLNPLQYLPVVGTLYRAVTGDTIPRPLREAGSLVVSGLLGGPVGIATNLAMLGFEKLTGIDLEDVEQNVLASLIPSHPGDAGAVAASVPGPGAAPAVTAQSSAQASAGPWTASQLAAYGVVTGADGELHQGALSGADVLNALQLSVLAS